MKTVILDKNQIEDFCQQLKISKPHSILIKLENSKAFYVINGEEKRELDFEIAKKYLG